MHTQKVGSPLNKIINVRIPNKPPSSLWDITIQDGRIASVDGHNDASSHEESENTLDGQNRLLAPSLCHAHIHLDKCFLLQDPKFSDLQIESGDFNEAMSITGQAKSRFAEDDLLRRGTRLIEESIQHGVTAMRAFVEIDGIVELKCLDAGLKLKELFQDRCEVQVCAFAQLPLFSGQDEGAQVRKLMTTAASYDKVDVLGSTPYVEDNERKSIENVRWITQLALQHDKHLDLHLDYFLEEEKQPLVWTALDIIRELKWDKKDNSKQIALGHCTRLTRFRNDEWTHLRQEAVASIGVGVYQAGTKKDAELLYETVSTRAKTAIGCEATDLTLQPGQPADFLMFDRMENGWHYRKSIADVVYDAGHARQTVYRGRLTASQG
ncbi:hypothetical protein GGP41_001717 [Bipolaris sorokiniana]|uniref:Amidohydrolase-related domain-containing protein n=1 Tax=Cochliobolus sativus TaxID=45130 RepID=A0A8H5ZRZ0_COCSA|nr:hypothetical protein GGP41_001717 [Bipolaris sorokiniana]